MQGRVLVVEADRAARDALVTGLRFITTDVLGASDTGEARRWLSCGGADVLVISDDFAEESLRELGAMFRMIVLARREATLPNYPAGSVLLRPITPRRVVEHVEAMLHAREGATTSLNFHDLSLHLDTGRVVRGEIEVVLAGLDLALLAWLMRQADRVLSRARILRELWPSGTHVEERTVDVRVRRLRESLKRLGCGGYLQTVRGSGYRFSAFT